MAISFAKGNLRRTKTFSKVSGMPVKAGVIIE
jgi:hypothetical protein